MKKYADDTVVQEQLAKTSTKGNRESIQSETTTREVSGCDMDNGEVLTALELAVKMVQSQTAELHNDKRTIKCKNSKNSRNTWSIISCYLSICISSILDVFIHVIRSVRTFLWPIFNNVFTTNISYNFATTSPSFALNSIYINSPIYCVHFAPLLVKSHCLLAFICWLDQEHGTAQGS